jgi:hypothetical protein
MEGHRLGLDRDFEGWRLRERRMVTTDLSMAEVLRLMGVVTYPMTDPRYAPPVSPKLHDKTTLLAPLTVGQRQVVGALLDRDDIPTYALVAERLDVSRGTVSQHLRRVRLQHPEVYEAVMLTRKSQLRVRHLRSEQRAAVRRLMWRHRHPRTLERDEFGRWPWERQGKP